MSMRLLLMAIIIGTALTCSNRYCSTCASRVVNLTITEICIDCQANFFVDKEGGCSMDLTKLISVIFIGMVIIALSLVVRWFLIELSSQRKPVYTADYQNKIYQYMNERKGSQKQSSASAGQQSDRNLLTNFQSPELLPCVICGKETAHGNKTVDTVTTCKHRFHALCLKSSMNYQLHNDPHNLPSCPDCKQSLYELTIHCQGCRVRSRNVLMEDKHSLCKLNSYTCFRCFNEKRWTIKENREKQCCGMGRYLYCYCLRDF